MKVAPLGDVKNNFTSYINKSKKEPIFITRNGRITAVIEHITDREVEGFLMERSKRFKDILNKAKR